MPTDKSGSATLSAIGLDSALPAARTPAAWLVCIKRAFPNCKHC